jgi:4-amino-4-deoxy-L-arabinose transferase-like glycosyltransferase
MNTKKIFIIIFLVAFLIRLAALLSFEEEKSLIYISDSLTYLQVAENLIEHQVYSMEISDTPHADNFRTPLYPIFLVPFVWLETSLYAPAIAQLLIVSAAIALFFLLARKIFSEKVSIIATTLFALEPFGALIESQIMTESIFILFFGSSILLLTLYIKDKKLKHLVIASAAMALAGLTRPIAFYLFILIPFAVLLSYGIKNIKWKQIGLGLLIFFVISSPWLIFTTFKLHSLTVSSIPSMQVYEYHATMFDEWRQTRGAKKDDLLPEVNLDPVNNTFDARAIGPIKEVGIEYIKSHAFEYVLFHTTRIPQLFNRSGYENILNGVGFLNFYHDSTDREVSNSWFEKIKNQPAFLFIAIADLFFIIITLLALVNPFLYNKLNKKFRKEIIFLIVLIILYSIIASPIASIRFRIPINIILFLLAFDSIAMLNKIYKIKKYD